MRPRAGPEWAALIERDAERALIDGALSGAESGHGRTVLLYGHSGVGRSSLLRASALDAESRGITVLQASGTELERGYGFGIVRQLLEARIAGLPPGQRRTLLDQAGPAAEAALGIGPPVPGVSTAGFDQIGGVHRLVVSLAAIDPLLLAVDDLQWCDRPSLDFLCFLGHRATRLPVTIIAAWRRGEPRVKAGRLQALAGQPETIFLTPAPLTPDGVRTMLTRDCAGDPADQAVDTVHAQTSGEPFLAGELVGGLRLRGIPVDGDCTAAIMAITPESVRRNIVARLGRHSDAVRHFAQAVAVLGDASLSQAAALAAISQDRARVAAAALVRSGILRDDSILRYAQPLLRAAVYDTLSSLERAELHHRAAALLASAPGSDPAIQRRLAEHLLRSEPTGDSRFAEVLREAAVRSAADGAPADARRFLTRALGDIETSRRAEVLAQLAELDLLAGDLPAAAIHAAEAMSLPSTPSAHAAACLACSQAVAATQGLAAAVELLDAQTPLLRNAHPALARDLQAAAATFRVFADTPPSASPEAIVEFEHLAGPTQAELVTLASWASHATLAGEATAARVADACARVLSHDGDPPADDAARYLAGRSALLCDAGPTLDAALARDCPPPAGHPTDDPPLVALALRAQRALARGDLAPAEADARAVIDAIEAQPSTPLRRRIHADLLAGLVMICLERADRGATELALAELDVVADGCAPAAASLRIAVALAASKPATALAAALAAARGPIGLAAPGLSWRPWAAVARHRVGDTPAALSLASMHLEHARAWGSLPLLGRALLVRGVVEPGDQRLQFIEAAIAVLEETSSRLDLARATIEHGAALRRARRRREAREQLVRGADLANRCGAELLSTRARAELVAVGARPRRAAFTGVGSLTRSELRVAQLAAAGMTNRAIAYELTVSAKTVAGQLTAVYRKLDVHDRAALATAMDAPDHTDLPAAAHNRESVR
ncbi:MAG: hypothetical protein QOH12_1495 [Solirubrobacteraceae bacterium]|jgi:DNA-binding CsgD family transcriptional regulator|nr:hypothetical protein [Solirubrobacteraceae bacterium]